MCLTQRHSTRREAREARKGTIAKQDIICYKLLTDWRTSSEKSWVTPYQYFSIQLGAHYYQEGKKFGLRTFKDYSGWNLEIEQGLHAWTTRDKADYMAKISWNQKAFKCIIPKGSIYYLGTNQDICADNLIIGKRPLKLK